MAASQLPSGQAPPVQAVAADAADTVVEPADVRCHPVREPQLSAASDLTQREPSLWVEALRPRLILTAVAVVGLLGVLSTLLLPWSGTHVVISDADRERLIERLRVRCTKAGAACVRDWANPDSG